MSPTYDEPAHLGNGLRMLTGDPAWHIPRAPFSAFNAAAIYFDHKIVSSQMLPDAAVQRARLVTPLFSILLALLIYHWAKELYGLRAAFLSLILYTFCPNILAHSRLVTTDLYACLMLTATLYTFWHFMKKPGIKNASLCALMLGLSQAAKSSCFFLYPFLLLTGLIHTQLFRKRWAAFGVYLLLFISISLLTLNAAFLFKQTGTPLNQYSLQSRALQHLKNEFPRLARFPIPLPSPYVLNLDFALSDGTQTRITYGHPYLLGKIADTVKPFPVYYFIAYLFKVPIASQIIFLLALFFYFRQVQKHSFFENEWLLLFPILFFFIYLNFFFVMQIGIRYLMLIFPLIFIFCGSLIREQIKLNSGIKTALGFLFCWQIISVLSYHPNYLAYFNELVWNRTFSYKILADSNLDWGQSRWYLKQYKARHPEAKISPDFPACGKIVVSVNDLVGVWDPEKYRWLRENFEPVGHIAYSYLIYDVSAERLAEIDKDKSVG